MLKYEFRLNYYFEHINDEKFNDNYFGKVMSGNLNKIVLCTGLY